MPWPRFADFPPRNRRSRDHASGCRLIGADCPGEITVHELVEITVEHSKWFTRLVACAEILDHVVGVDHVRSNLVTPPSLDMLALQCESLGFAPLGLDFEELRAQDSHRSLAILQLGAFSLAGHDDTRGH